MPSSKPRSPRKKAKKTQKRRSPSTVGRRSWPHVISVTIHQGVLDLLDIEAEARVTDRLSLLRIVILRGMGRFKSFELEAGPFKTLPSVPSKMVRLNISMTTEMREWLDARTAEAGHISISALITQLALGVLGINPLLAILQGIAPEATGDV